MGLFKKKVKKVVEHVQEKVSVSIDKGIESAFDPKSRPVELYTRKGSNKTYVSKLGHEFDFDAQEDAKAFFDHLAHDSQNLL